ncbi:MAG TPA: hypothetical protein VJU86_18675 [Pyrinomonadaceae bacterium]|nr:hypothetical protein [Pyrinomonadaceae bacterium]
MAAVIDPAKLAATLKRPVAHFAGSDNSIITTEGSLRFTLGYYSGRPLRRPVKIDVAVLSSRWEFLPNKFSNWVVYRGGGEQAMRDPFTAGLLSFLIPGVGQLYNGRILAGILWLIITPGFWIGSGGTLGWICHIIAAYTAYSYAKDHPVRA